MTDTKQIIICDAVAIEELRAERTFLQNRVLVLAQTCHNLDERVAGLQEYCGDLQRMRDEAADREAVALARAASAEEALWASRVPAGSILPTRPLSVESMSRQDQLEKYGEGETLPYVEGDS